MTIQETFDEVATAGQKIQLSSVRIVHVQYMSTPGRPQYTLRITQWDTPLGMRDGYFKSNIPDGAASTSMQSLTSPSASGQ